MNTITHKASYLIALALITANNVLAQANPADVLQPKTDVTQNPAWEPIKTLIGNGIFLLLVLVVVGAVVNLALNAYKYSSSGDDINKRNLASEGMRNSLIGLGIGLGSIFIVSAILFMLKQAGISPF